MSSIVLPDPVKYPPTVQRRYAIDDWSRDDRWCGRPFSQTQPRAGHIGRYRHVHQEVATDSTKKKRQIYTRQVMERRTSAFSVIVYVSRRYRQEQNKRHATYEERRQIHKDTRRNVILMNP